MKLRQGQAGDERARLLEVLGRFAWEPDDEVGADRRVWEPRANTLDEPPVDAGGVGAA